MAAALNFAGARRAHKGNWIPSTKSECDVQPVTNRVADRVEFAHQARADAI